MLVIKTTAMVCKIIRILQIQWRAQRLGSVWWCLVPREWRMKLSKTFYSKMNHRVRLSLNPWTNLFTRVKTNKIFNLLHQSIMLTMLNNLCKRAQLIWKLLRKCWNQQINPTPNFNKWMNVRDLGLCKCKLKRSKFWLITWGNSWFWLKSIITCWWMSTSIWTCNLIRIRINNSRISASKLIANQINYNNNYKLQFNPLQQLLLNRLIKLMGILELLVKILACWPKETMLRNISSMVWNLWESTSMRYPSSHLRNLWNNKMIKNLNNMKFHHQVLNRSSIKNLKSQFKRPKILWILMIFLLATKMPSKWFSLKSTTA